MNLGSGSVYYQLYERGDDNEESAAGLVLSRATDEVYISEDSVMIVFTQTLLLLIPSLKIEVSE